MAGVSVPKNEVESIFGDPNQVKEDNLNLDLKQLNLTSW